MELGTAAALATIAAGGAAVYTASQSGKSISKVPGVPQPPLKDDKGVQEAAAAEARRRQLARGFRSTLLSKDFMADSAPALKQTLGS